MNEEDTGGKPSDSHPTEEGQPEQAKSEPVVSYPWEPKSDPVTLGYVEKARKALDNLQYQKALDICEEAEAKGIKHPRIILNKSSALYGLKMYDEACVLLEKSLEEYPDNPYFHYHLAFIYKQKRRKAEAKIEAREVLELLKGIKNSEIDERLSICISDSLWILHRFRDAIRVLEAAVRKFPDNESLHYKLGIYHAETLDLIKALKQRKWLHETYRRSVNVTILISAALDIVLLLFTGTLFILLLTVTFGTRNLAGICLVTLFLLAVGIMGRPLTRSTKIKRAHAIDRWAKPIDFSMDSAVAEASSAISPSVEELKEAVNTARELYSQWKNAKSLYECERAEALGLDSAELAMMHSVVLIKLRRIGDAERFINEKLAVYPDSDGLYYNLILINAKYRKKFREAEEILAEAMDKCPESGCLAAAKTLILLKRQKYADTEAFANNELASYPDEPLLHLNLGSAYFALFKWRKWREEYRRAYTLDRTLKRVRNKKLAVLLIIFLCILLPIIVLIQPLPTRHSESHSPPSKTDVNFKFEKEPKEGLKSVMCLTYNETDGKMYGGTDEGYIFAQEDSSTWVKVGRPTKSEIVSIIYNPSDSKTYAANLDGKFYSYDGKKWSNAGLSKTDSFYGFCCGNKDIGLLALSKYNMEDVNISKYEGGKTWRDIPGSPPGASYLYYDSTDSKLYAACASGFSYYQHVFVFDGNQWTGIGLKGGKFPSCIVRNGKDLKLYASDEGDRQVYRQESGSKWKTFNVPNDGDVITESLLVFNPNDNKLYLTWKNSKIYSFDGNKWSIAHDCGMDIDCMIYNPADRKLYAAGFYFISTYDGEHWIDRNINEVY